MPVPLPRMCAVLAHEMRGPLGVLQGYARLLHRRHAPDAPEAAMLEAMLEATRRLADISSQASSLGTWLAKTKRTPVPRIESAVVSRALAERLRHSPAITFTRPADSTSRLVLADPVVLADAIAAVAESVRRDHEDAVVEVSEPIPATATSPWFIVRVQRPSPIEHVESRASSRHRFSFDRSGAGLALIAAAAVFDIHGMTLEPDPATGNVSLGFPRTETHP